ncbi:MAG TPA: GNAT family N-acetyltransferase [Allosphingosinicella sp.]|nr:GNAT family N-acetyltransferase [Allosphingosinicella sp.]
MKLFDDLDAVEADAAGALDRPAQPLLFDRLDWYRRVAEHCPPPGRLLAARAASNGGKAWLFLTVEGARAQALACWYSLRTGIVTYDPDQEQISETSESIARELRRTGLARLSLYPLGEEPVALADAFRRAGWIVRTEPAGVSWQVTTEGQDFAAYWEGRPSRLRNTAQRKAKAAGLEIAIHRRFDAAAWADYETVYAASWKSEEGSPAFLRAMAEEEGAAGTLRLGIARKDGKPVAAQLWTIENCAAWIHKLAYDEAAKPLSPGTILSMAMFRSALDEDRVSRIDYGTGDDAYKRDWMEIRAPLWRLDAYNPRRLAGLLGAARAGASALAGRLRSH